MKAVWLKLKHQGVRVSAADTSVLTSASELYLPLCIFALLSGELSSSEKKVVTRWCKDAVFPFLQVLGIQQTWSKHVPSREDTSTCGEHIKSVLIFGYNVIL